MVLNINNEKRYVSKDITIKDQIQGGQQLDLSTLNINDRYIAIIIVDKVQLLILKKPFQVLK